MLTPSRAWQVLGDLSGQIMDRLSDDELKTLVETNARMFSQSHSLFAPVHYIAGNHDIGYGIEMNSAWNSPGRCRCRLFVCLVGWLVVGWLFVVCYCCLLLSWLYFLFGECLFGSFLACSVVVFCALG